MSDLAIHAGKLIDGTGQVLTRVTVLVKGNRIEKVVKGEHEPRGYDVIDARDKTILPGLIDTHNHLSKIDQREESGPLFESFLSDQEQQRIFDMFLSNGVTTVRDLGGSLERLLLLRADVAKGAMRGPRILCSGYIDASVAPWRDHAFIADDAESARRIVKSLAILGLDCVKVYANVKPEVLRAIVAEAHRRGMLVTGHLNFGVRAIQAIKIGIDGIEHITSLDDLGFFESGMGRDKLQKDWLSVELDRLRLWERLELSSPRVRRLIREIVKKGTFVCPTLGIYEKFYAVNGTDVLDDPATRFLPRRVVDSWQLMTRVFREGWTAADVETARSNFRKMQSLVVLLKKAGAKIACGTDGIIGVGPGSGSLREIELFVEAGLTPMDAILSATRDAAEAIGKQTELGTILPGMMADMIILSGDPLQDIKQIRSIERVIHDGKVLDPRDLSKAS